MPFLNYIACPLCDQLHRLPLLKAGDKVYCCHCRNLILRYPSKDLSHGIAWLGAALVFYLLANLYPLVSLNLNGIEQQTNLLGTSLAFYNNGQPLLALLVFATSLLIPLLTIICNLYALWSLYRRHQTVLLSPCLKFISQIRHWEMVDVFVLSILVALVKLAGMAHILFNTGFYCLILAMVAAIVANRQIETWLLWHAHKTL